MEKKILRLCINSVESSLDNNEEEKGKYFINISKNAVGEKICICRDFIGEKIKSYDIIREYLNKNIDELEDGQYFIILQENDNHSNIIDFNYYVMATIKNNFILYFDACNCTDSNSGITELLVLVDNINISRSFFDNGYWHFIDCVINGKKHIIKFKSENIKISYKEILYALANDSLKTENKVCNINLIIDENLKELVYEPKALYLEIEDKNIKTMNFGNIII